MHFAFIAYGARHELDLLLRDMEAQKFKLRMWKEGELDKAVFIPGQIRVLPFGVMEYVFPKEYMDLVLRTMCGNTAPNRYGIPKMFKEVFRRALKLKPVPKYDDKGDKIIWTIENVSIMPIGIREDFDLSEPKDMGFRGWMHEAI